jgi:hypothetical protein
MNVLVREEWEIVCVCECIKREREKERVIWIKWDTSVCVFERERERERWRDEFQSPGNQVFEGGDYLLTALEPRNAFVGCVTR